MKLPIRDPDRSATSALRGTLRTGRPTRHLLPRLRPGDVAVIDQVDLDAASARAMVSAGVVAVVNARPMVSGRFPNRGPEVLAKAGVCMLEEVGETGFSALVDGREVRLEGTGVYDGEQRLATGRRLEQAELDEQLALARAGLAVQVETLTHNSSELLRREEDLLLHGAGLPQLGTAMADLPVLVVGGGDAAAQALRAVRGFVHEQRPVVIGVGSGADLARRRGPGADVVVLGPDPEQVPAAATLRRAHEVVVVGTPGSADAVGEALGRMGIAPASVETALAPVDVAALLAAAHHARLVVTTEGAASLVDLLESDRPSPAGGALLRLALGARLVDAASVPLLESGRLHRRDVVLVLLACALLVAFAVAATPAGQDWLGHLVPGGRP